MIFLVTSNVDTTLNTPRVNGYRMGFVREQTGSILNREVLSNHDPRQFRRLWAIALATYGVGDVVTTIVLLQFLNTVNELNVLLESIVGLYGQAGLIAVKIAVFLIAIGVSLYGDRVNDWVLYYFPPTALAVIGGFATAFNLRLFFA